MSTSRFTKSLGLAALLGLTAGTIASVVSAQIPTRMHATLATDVATGTPTPVTCTQSGTGCFLDVSIAGGSAGFANGTSLAPSIAFASEPTTGFWHRAAGLLDVNTTGGAPGIEISGGGIVKVAADGGLFFSPTNSNAVGTADLQLIRGAAGRLAITTTGGTIGSALKVDALPTVASGFGTSPAVTAGSTPLAGSVNVGTGGVATSGVINFNGTAFPSAPFVVCMNTTTAAVVRCTATTTQLTMTAPAAFTASDVVAWVAISPK